MKSFQFLFPVCSLLIVASLNAQTLAPIYDNTPVKKMEIKTLVTLPEKTFLENMAFWHGKLLVTSHLAGKVLQLGSDNQLTDIITVPGRATAIVAVDDNTLFINGWNANQKSTLWRVDKTNQATEWLTLPDAQFLNGMLLLEKEYLLVADSYAGKIWSIHIPTKTISVFLSDPAITRGNAENPLPGANGIKLHNGYVYISNTQNQTLLRVPVKGVKPSGPVELVTKNQNIDDFWVLSNNDVLGATHFYNSAVLVHPNGSAEIIGTLAEGLAGSTAVVPVPGTKNQYYISTNGGMSIPPPSGIEKSKLLIVTLK